MRKIEEMTNEELRNISKNRKENGTYTKTARKAQKELRTRMNFEYFVRTLDSRKDVLSYDPYSLRQHEDSSNYCRECVSRYSNMANQCRAEEDYSGCRCLYY